MQWKPIKSAPKDGARLLVYESGIGQFCARWCDIADGFWEFDPLPDAYYDTTEVRPTHWMPLPDPPTDEFITLPRMEME